MYYITLIIIGSFFMLNLVLGVLSGSVIPLVDSDINLTQLSSSQQAISKGGSQEKRSSKA